MYIIKEDDYVFVPMAFNVFCKDIDSIRNNKHYDVPISAMQILGRAVVEELYAYIITSKEKLYIIDMKNIVSYPERQVSVLKKIENRKFVFINVSESFIGGMSEELGVNIFDRVENIVGDREACEMYSNKKKKIKETFQSENVRIIDEITEYIKESDDIKPLDSSNVYCNMYVNVKRLFLDPMKYRFVIYQLIVSAK